MTTPIERLEERLGYQFKDRELLFRALTHRSCAAEQGALESIDNEQFEFLGDSVLGFIVCEALVARLAEAREGELSQWKSHLVSATHLHRCALSLNLGEFLLLGKGEERNGGRERKTVLANAFEALIAAMHLDGGIDIARKFIIETVLTGVDEVDGGNVELLNHKSVLQERTQAMGFPIPRYATIGTSGPEHAKLFTVEVRVGDNWVGRATGTSKKAASQLAAEVVLGQLPKHPIA
jgi:ribonuclease-3